MAELNSIIQSDNGDFLKKDIVDSIRVGAAQDTTISNSPSTSFDELQAHLNALNPENQTNVLEEISEVVNSAMSNRFFSGV